MMLTDCPQQQEAVLRRLLAQALMCLSAGRFWSDRSLQPQSQVADAAVGWLAAAAVSLTVAVQAAGGCVHWAVTSCELAWIAVRSSLWQVQQSRQLLPSAG